MSKTLSRLGIAVACGALMAGPTFAQSDTGTGAAGSGATDQAGSQPGSASGTGTSGTAQTGTSDSSKKASDVTKKSSATSSETSSPADRTFVRDATVGGLAEVKLATLAADKASENDVKKFAQMLVDDHTKANDKLTKIARDRGYAAPPSELKSADQAFYDRLSKMSGAAFDRAYIKHMVADHEKHVEQFRKESRSGSDPDVKAFAASTLSTLEKHLQDAKDLQGKLGGTASTSGKKDTTPTHRGTSGTTRPTPGTPPASGATPPPL
jgi:putative membrane protein